MSDRTESNLPSGVEWQEVELLRGSPLACKLMSMKEDMAIAEISLTRQDRYAIRFIDPHAVGDNLRFQRSYRTYSDAKRYVNHKAAIYLADKANRDAIKRYSPNF